MLLHIGFRGLGVRKAGVGGGRDFGAGSHVLHEAFGAFKLRGGLAGAEAGNAFGADFIGKAQGQRDFGADHDEVDGKLAADCDDFVHVFGGDGQAFRDVCDARVARGAIKFLAQGRLGKGPAQSMFTTTRADDEDFHGECLELFMSSRLYAKNAKL